MLILIWSLIVFYEVKSTVGPQPSVDIYTGTIYGLTVKRAQLSIFIQVQLVDGVCRFRIGSTRERDQLSR